MDKIARLRTRYNDVKRRLHCCSPAERADLLRLLNMLYRRLQSLGVAA